MTVGEHCLLSTGERFTSDRVAAPQGRHVLGRVDPPASHQLSPNHGWILIYGHRAERHPQRADDHPVKALAALTVLLLAGWLAGKLRFLAPHKSRLFHLHAPLLGGVTLILFLNLCAIYYSVARWLFLRETGRKLLLHLDRQRATDDTAIEDLRPFLKS